ncbi:hypothetical protein C5167_031660 [Papaver somniferum]|uniref:Uncharacterized protein n=1 Tax=Papaver somniferum TaxID=3469 RepID=A0A4Y7K7X3_PAPSO|nr:uncharacterized protein LOC113295725 [Papaver somniferum]RZC68422.1 hypothetical protein C5167_031660 [Papaver somniferum]
MEAEVSSTHDSPYSLQPFRFYNEDILLFYIDIGLESQVEMKVSGPKGRPITWLESTNPDHRFASASLAQVASWHQKEFSNGVGSAIASLRGLVYSLSPQGNADLTQLFRIAAHEAKKSRAQNRLLRVMLGGMVKGSITKVQRGYWY